MIVSIDWIKEHIDIEIPLEELEEKLTALGLECSIKKKEFSFKDIIIGKVLSVDKVENSDHLNSCIVDVGDEKLNIVCGAPNVKMDIHVPVAIPGATLDNGKFKIKKTKIRGEVSNGMICSERELGISDSHKGIMILDKDSNIGEDFASAYFPDTGESIELDLTPNRGDCFSHLGVAREIAIIEDTKIKIRDKSIKPKKSTKDVLSPDKYIAIK